MSERRKGIPQRLAAARAGMSERTARKYEHEGKLPSQLKRPHDWQTRVNPFEQDWPWVVEQLTRDPALQGSTLFAQLYGSCAKRRKKTGRCVTRLSWHTTACSPPGTTQVSLMRTGMSSNPIIAGSEAVDQALRARGSRDFASRPDYDHFLQVLVYNRNLTRAALFTAERATLRPLPAAQLAPCKELRVRVSRFSTIAVLGNLYSVPSRLIGTSVLIRVRAETLEGYVGTSRAFTLPRLLGKKQHRISYQHIIWSLVRKPGAFAAYRYRDELFPTTTFRLAYDQLGEGECKRADRDYVRILHLAASTSESEVETALTLLLEAGKLPTFDAVRDLVSPSEARAVPQIEKPILDLSPYDQFLPSRRVHA